MPEVGLVALCAARSVPKEGDHYLDDSAHHALAQKFWLDYPEVGITTNPLVAAAIAREESNNPARTEWDKTYGDALNWPKNGAP